MVKKVEPKLPPTGWRKHLWRAPIHLYKIGLGPVMGKKFLLLNHIGRKSGQVRQAVLEIDRYDPETNTYIVASGFGRKSDWYRNLQKTPDVTIQLGRKKLKARAELLTPEQSGEEMARYAQAHRKAALNLIKLIGLEVENPDDLEEWRTVGREYIPFVALHVQGPADKS
jgi:deazaflavin-dependent oxidoreductase (nitroreductase family)